jgi:hypothetical protein
MLDPFHVNKTEADKLKDQVINKQVDGFFMPENLAPKGQKPVSLLHAGLVAEC